jgi:hypothetical protein
MIGTQYHLITNMHHATLHNTADHGAHKRNGIGFVDFIMEGLLAVIIV